MRARKQQLTLVLLIATCQLVIACARPPSPPPCYSIVNASVGSSDSAETGARAAVRRLSQEIQRCGEAKEYYIQWSWPGSEQERGWRAIRYFRKDKTSGVAGYEYDPMSGTLQPTYLVDDSAVHQVAKEGGTLSDFAKYQKEKK